MHYVTRISHWMPKHKVVLTCPIALFVESVRMQKHKFGVTCPVALLLNLYRSQPSMKNSVWLFCVPDAMEGTT
jgi:hypothetical protein